MHSADGTSRRFHSRAKSCLGDAIARALLIARQRVAVRLVVVTGARR